MWLYYFNVIYIIFFGFFVKANNNITSKKVYLFFTFAYLGILAAFRGKTIGNDTEFYMQLFDSISAVENVSVYSPRFELGYVYLNKFLSIFTSNPQIILIVSSLIIFYCFMRFIKKYSSNIPLSVFLFFALGYFSMAMNTIRLSLALSIVLISYDFLRNNKIVKFIILIILAFLFHRTAIIFLLAWPITYLKYSKKVLIAVMIVAVGVYIFFGAILDVLFQIFPTYSYYIDSSYLDGQIRIASILNFFVGIAIILLGICARFYDNKDASKGHANSAYLLDAKNMWYYILLSSVITFVSFKFNLLDRVGDYFLVFSIVYLPNAINSLKNRKLSVTISYIVFILFFIYSTAILYLRPEWNRIYPYYFFWSN